MLTPPKSFNYCMLWQAAYLCLSATVFTLQEPIVAKITTFLTGSHFWRPPSQASLNLGGQDLDCWNLRLMLKIKCRLSWSISSHFVTIHCWNVRCSQKLQKITKTLLLWVPGCSRSSMLTNLKSPSLLLMICSKSVPIFNRFHTITVKCGKITFLEGCPSLTFSFKKNPFTQRHEILSLKTSVLGAAYSENFVIPFW